MNAVAAELLSGYGLVEASFDDVAARLGTYRRADQASASVAAMTGDPNAALNFLSHRTWPATRLVFVETPGWTTILTNHRGGSDFNDHQHWAAWTLHRRSIRVVDSDALWTRVENRRKRLAYAARIFALHGPDNETIRSIACADDGGRWVFETVGTPLPAEAPFPYDSVRKKDRFTRENLHTLIRSVGAMPFMADDFLGATRFALVKETPSNPAWEQRIEAHAVTVAPFACDIAQP